MQENWINFENQEKPKILIAGVGGAGINILNTLINKNIDGVDFIALNTDSQSLMSSRAKIRVPLGAKLTKGFGTGGNPEIGKQSAIENLDALKDFFNDYSLIFFVGGLGGGTGSGALPVLSKLASDNGILNVSIITQPFAFEGDKRKQISADSLLQLSASTSSYVIIPNENFFTAFDNNVPITQAFLNADEQIASGIKGITDIINTTGQINLDFADIKSILDGGGQIMVNSATVEGDNKVEQAIQEVLENPLIDKGNATSAKQVLLQISGGNDITLSQIKDIMEKVKSQLKTQENFIFGTNFSADLNGKLVLSLIATGLNNSKPTDFKYTSFSDFTKPILQPKPMAEIKEEIIEPIITIRETIIEIPEMVEDEIDEEIIPFIVEKIEVKEEPVFQSTPFEIDEEAVENIAEFLQDSIEDEEEFEPISDVEIIIEEVDESTESLDISSMSFGGNDSNDIDKRDTFSDKLKNIFSHKNADTTTDFIAPQPERKTEEKIEKREQSASYDLMDLFRDVPSLNQGEDGSFESFLKEQEN